MRVETMGLVSQVLAFLSDVLKALVYQWVPLLLKLLRRLYEICFTRWARRKAGRGGRASPSACNPIDETAYHTPDPMIYSQYDLMSRGFAVVWDNPDIEVRKGGIVVPSSNLDPNTEYEIVARIWNKATDAPVVGLPVLFFFLSFGNGIKGHPIGATAVNLGVKGGPNHPAFAPMKWTTPLVAGHYCIMVLLAPASDQDFMNNLGQENLNVGIPHSPAEFTFQLRNEKPHEEIFRFEVDTYQLPAVPRCDDGEPSVRPVDAVLARPRLPETRAGAVPLRHDRRNYPIPAGWSVDCQPRDPRVAAGAERPILIRITPPADFHGRQPFQCERVRS
jgi:hypothetical protein